MFKWYGFLGIILIILVELSFFIPITSIARIYFPLAWFSYILIIDAIIYKIRGSSLISNRFGIFLGMVVISSLFWDLFEFLNYAVKNWSYIGGDFWLSESARRVYHMISFSTVLPAIFETFELLRSLHLFDKIKLRKKHKISKHFLLAIIYIGILMLPLTFLLPNFTYPLVWLAFFFILDPINYLHKQPSIMQHLKDRKLSIPISLLLAGIICGFFWEFWNYWAPNKWVYNIPFIGFFKIFEMPILGYLGYFPFSFELYSMYFFVQSLFKKKERLLTK